MEDLIRKLECTAKVVGAVTTVIATILAFIDGLEKLWDRYLKPVAKWLACWASPFIVNAIVLWYLLYFAAMNASRLWEVRVFLALFAQAAILTSLCTFFWGIWLHPKLRGLIRKPESPLPLAKESGTISAGKETG